MSVTKVKKPLTKVKKEVSLPMADRSIVVAGLGETLWDVFETGPRFGGAPVNFACSVSGLAPDHISVAMVTAVGTGDEGDAAVKELAAHEVLTDFVQRNEFETGKVFVTTDEQGCASYEFLDNAAWDHLRITSQNVELAKNVDAVCFGSLGQRGPTSRHSIQTFLRATSPSALRIFDINLRPPFYSDSVISESLELANVLKCNDDELAYLSELLDLNGDDDKKLVELVRRCSLELAILTRGDGDSTIVTGNGDRSVVTSEEVMVADTVGAGDAFIAAFTLGCLLGMPIEQSHRRATNVAAFVCTQEGATPRIPDDLRFCDGAI